MTIYLFQPDQKPFVYFKSLMSLQQVCSEIPIHPGFLANNTVCFAMITSKTMVLQTTTRGVGLATVKKIQNDTILEKM